MPPIEVLPDCQAFRWIEAALRTPVSVAPDDDDLRTLDLVPPCFEAYAKLLHPIYENPDLRDSPMTWADAPEELHDLPDEQWSRIARWADVATLLDSRWEVSIHEPRLGSSWPVRFAGPDEGLLEERYLASLVEVLGTFQARGPCYFWWWVVPALGAFDGETTLRGPLSELPAYLREKRGLFSPTYWWPEDRNWCVATDWDLTFTMIGGSARFVDAVLSMPESEGFRVGANDVVLAYGDRRS